jgi:hypothetical protein
MNDNRTMNRNQIQIINIVRRMVKLVIFTLVTPTSNSIKPLQPNVVRKLEKLEHKELTSFCSFGNHIECMASICFSLDWESLVKFSNFFSSSFILTLRSLYSFINYNKWNVI